MNAMKKVLGRLADGWQQEEETKRIEAQRRQLAAQMQMQQMQYELYMNQAMQATNTFANNQTTTAGSTLGGALSYPGSMFPTTGTYTAAARYPLQMTDAQFASFLAFMERALKHSWTCKRCQREYAPMTPDCEFCNVIDRLEGKE
jgi:ATP/maltotriose-dependent transcriptional regulator MalT